MKTVTSRIPAAAVLLALLAAVAAVPAGCGSQSEEVKVGVIEIVDSFNSAGSAELVDSGMQQLSSELAVDASLEECKASSLSEEVASAEEAGNSLILVTGRGSQVLDPAKRSAGVPLAALGISLSSPAGSALSGADLATVRYKVEEGAWLSGVLAAGMTVSRGHPWINADAVVGFIGYQGGTDAMAYLKGFETGVASVNPNCAIAEYGLSDPGDTATARVQVEACLKLKADIIFCGPGSFSGEVLAMGTARGFLVITSDADGSDSDPEAQLAETVLRDDLAMFRVTRLFLQGDFPAGSLEWGISEDVVDFSANMKLYNYFPASVVESLKQSAPDIVIQ